MCHKTDKLDPLVAEYERTHQVGACSKLNRINDRAIESKQSVLFHANA